VEKNKWPIMLRTKILKFARVSTILTVFAQWYFYFRYYFTFLTCAGNTLWRYVPTQHRLLVIYCLKIVSFSDIYIFSIKTSSVKVSTIFHHFLYFRFECPAFIVKYLVISKFNIPLNLDVTVYLVYLTIQD